MESHKLGQRTSEKLCACYKTEVQKTKMTKLELNVRVEEGKPARRKSPKERTVTTVFHATAVHDLETLATRSSTSARTPSRAPAVASAALGHDYYSTSFV